jgi:peptide/nickel transport system ATP-binding protein
VPATLQVEDLCVEFHTHDGVLRALDHVSLTIEPGQIVGVVGESGAGKSLTGAAIAGLIEPPGRVVAGRVLLQGERIDGLRGEQWNRIRGRGIGTVFQDPLTSLNPLFTIGDQLVETIRAHQPLSRQEAARKALALLQETGIPGAAQRLQHYPHQFSGGMRQRVVIALALAADPVLIVADEPTTALDVSVQAQVMDMLGRLCRERGAAMMLITHDMGVIAESCDRVAVMYAGRVVEQGPVRAVIDAPAHPYTRGLMASIPDMASDPRRLNQIDGAMPRLQALPSGCAFHPRCALAQERCRREAPPLQDAGPTQAACWLVTATEELAA